MRLFDKLKKDKKEEPVDLSKKPEEENKDVPPEPPKIETKDKLANMFTVIYESITDENTDLTDIELSTKIDENKKLIIKIESI